MKKAIKQLIKKIPIAFTKNQLYDRQTQKIIARICSPGTNCIDIGAHKGEVLDIMLKHSPTGVHYAFEPIPSLYQDLVKKYQNIKNCKIFDIALSDTMGTSTFNYVISNPSYSGLIKRKYDRDNEQDTSITVKTDLLDNILPGNYAPGLIKIDVEGGEFLVLQGAMQTIRKHRPVIIFEHGLGASDMYGTTPDKLFNLLQECGLKVSVMKHWLNNQSPLTLQQFENIYRNNSEYYFIAHP